MLARYENSRTFIMTSTTLGVSAVFAGLVHALNWLPSETTEREAPAFVSSAVWLLCGGLLLVAAFALRTVRASGWRNALVAHCAALVCLLIAGVLMLPVATVLNLAFHVGLFSLIALNAMGLWRLRPRNPLKRAQHEIAARMY